MRAPQVPVGLLVHDVYGFIPHMLAIDAYLHEYLTILQFQWIYEKSTQSSTKRCLQLFWSHKVAKVMGDAIVFTIIAVVNY